MSETSGGAQVIARFYEAFNAGDMAGAFALLSPSIVWTYHGPRERIPFAGTFHGHAGVTEFFDRVAGAIELIEMTPGSLVALGEEVYGRGIEHSRSLATGKEYRLDWAHVYVVEHGLITAFDEFIDTATVAEALDGGA